MIPYSAKKSLIYKEMFDEKRTYFFDMKQKKFLHNIDTLYYVVKVKTDWLYDPNAIYFKDLLQAYQNKAFSTPDMLPVFTSEDLDGKAVPKAEWMMNGVAASKIYRYDLQQPDKFAVFIAPSTPNENTPEIIVQLRSQYLWLEGEKQAILKSLADVEDLLNCFGLEILEVKENRIDYAYHTNYIQNPTKYFKHENINKMQQSRFSRGSIEFSFRNQWETETDYLTLGRKKSNNLFFRIYDKTKEVIQQGYKQFFIKLWYMEKLISYFDMYCIEKAFLNPSADNYKYLDVARLEFYLEHGKNEEYRGMIRELLSQPSRDYESIIALADLLTPTVTKILNVEFETKRKFYSTLDDTINNILQVKSDNVPAHASKLFRIIDNKKLFHDFITRNTSDGSGVIRFIDYKAKNRLGEGWKHKRDYPTSDFWSRLQSVSTDWYQQEDVVLVRQYQKNLSMHLLKKGLMNKLSVYSLYKNSEVKNDTFTDALDFVSTLNETDLEKANQYKAKKYLLLKDRLQNVETSLAKENDFGIVNLKTGEIIASDSLEDEPGITEDYNTSPADLNTTAYEIHSVDDVYESLMHDLELEKRKYESILKSDITKNQRLVYQTKLDKLIEKINELRNF
ncbi:hypothetical protein ACTHQ8_22725 [Lysinibacillus odysseyi]|uniref:hypothetical protein n=3 Tax=Lysinibacillus odysseyi TaxID=202611 RepID=UPI0007AB95E8|nr:hypothetical protein [Lysinibacillus odysseyi]